MIQLGLDFRHAELKRKCLSSGIKKVKDMKPLTFEYRIASPLLLPLPPPLSLLPPPLLHLPLLPSIEHQFCSFLNHSRYMKRCWEDEIGTCVLKLSHRTSAKTIVNN